nr:hypothetical protein RTCK_01504 [Rhizobium sp. TCK]
MNDRLFPDVLTPDDLQQMSVAYLRAREQLNRSDRLSDVDEHLARIIMRNYRRDLTDPKKLATLAALMVSAKLSRSDRRPKVSL